MAGIAGAALLVAGKARGADAPGMAVDTDRTWVRARSSTYVQFFERALLPGPGGARVASDTLVPVFEYIQLRAVGVDAPWSEDSVDFEVSGWGNGQVMGSPGDPAFDGDVTVANVSHHLDPMTLSLGRHVRPAGTQRVLHFDGATFDFRSSVGIGVSGYAGLTVLPRWAQRPGYQHLGSAADTLLKSPDALPEPKRTGNWLGGIRLDYANTDLGSVGASFHEEQEQAALGRRDIGLDAQVTAIDATTVTVAGLLDTDSTQLADAVAAVDVSPVEAADLTAEFRHSDPRLLLSRQSVLSVFTTSQYDELGAAATVRCELPLEAGAAGYLQWFGPDATGTRLRGRLRLALDSAQRSFVSAAVGRVKEPQNGYSSVRVSVSYLVVEPLRTTAEHYSYFYDTPVLGVSSSSVEGVSTEWAVVDGLRLLVGGSFARSPYATMDAQALVRVVYETQGRGGGQ